MPKIAVPIKKNPGCITGVSRIIAASKPANARFNFDHRKDFRLQRTQNEKLF